MVIKTDDNTRFFADRCSYSFKVLPTDKIKKMLKGPIPTSQVPGELLIRGGGDFFEFGGHCFHHILHCPFEVEKRELAETASTTVNH